MLLVLFLAKGVIISFVHVPFSGHDEVMHYAYLEYVATEFRLPVIPELEEWRSLEDSGDESNYDRANAELWPYCQFTTQDWNISCQRYISPTWKSQLSDRVFPMGWVYTANHPPLYYLIMTPVYWAVNDLSLDMQSYLFRLATLPFGLVTVLFAYLTARTMFPRDRFMALTVPTFVAFQPQISYEAAMLNNDAAAIAFTSVTIYLLVRGLKNGFEWGTVALVGFFFGLAALSKNTSLTMGLAIACAMILGLGIRNIRSWLPKGIFAAGIAALLLVPWFAYMVQYLWRFHCPEPSPGPAVLELRQPKSADDLEPAHLPAILLAALARNLGRVRLAPDPAQRHAAPDHPVARRDRAWSASRSGRFGCGATGNCCHRTMKRRRPGWPATPTRFSRASVGRWWV